MRSLQPQVKAIQERYAGDQVIIVYILICYKIIYISLLRMFSCWTTAHVRKLISLMCTVPKVRVNLSHFIANSRNGKVEISHLAQFPLTKILWCFCKKASWLNLDVLLYYSLWHQAKIGILKLTTLHIQKSLFLGGFSLKNQTRSAVVFQSAF
jgi:hypothetical protein